jgi:hypothetical protein
MLIRQIKKEEKIKRKKREKEIKMKKEVTFAIITQQ